MRWLMSDRFSDPAWVVLDGGANQGLYTLLAASVVGPAGRVLAVEPSSRELGRLATAIRINKLANVTVVPVALSDAAGEGDLLVAESEHGGHNAFGKLRYAEVRVVDTVRVRMRTIDEISDECKLERLDFVKLDLEGYEAKALRGAGQTLERFRPTLLIEWPTGEGGPEVEQDCQELLDLLEQFRYVALAIDPGTGLPSERQMAIGPSENVIAVPE